jgi:phosphoribosylcarboxyaminoimidazole (NCAIR) mutase
LLAVAMLASGDPALQAKLLRYRRRLSQESRAKNRSLQAKLASGNVVASP